MTDRIPIEPTVLEWARMSSGLSMTAAAKKLSVSETTIENWESGSQAPTIKQLRKAAKGYGRPLAVLLLPRQPMDFSPLRDFRRLAAGDGLVWSPALHREFRRALSQREVLLELEEVAPATVDSGEDLPQIDPTASVDAVAAKIRTALKLDELSTVEWARARETLNALVDRVEERGVLVVQTIGIELDEMRAFSVSEWPFPIVALNGKDWPRPKLFSLLHEICHLVLNDGGVCDMHEVRQSDVPRTPSDEVEHYCNRIAAAVLMPTAAFLEDSLVARSTASHQWPLDELAELGQRFGASSEAALLRLISLGKANWDLYWTRKVELSERYVKARAEEKARRQKARGGPSYYAVKARNLGHGYVHSVLDAYRSRAISSLDVADYLDVRYEQIPKLEKVIRP